MAIGANDIVFVYSGGTANNDPAESLGGDPSAIVIGNLLNNLFPDTQKESAGTGKVDYRCIYIFNNHSTDSLFDVSLYMANDILGGATLKIGVETSRDIQRVAISGPVSGGFLVMQYENQTFNWNYDSDLNVWGQNLEDELNNLSLLSGVFVNVSTAGGTRFFEIHFAGDDDKKFHDLLTVVNTTNLVGSFTVSAAKLVDGAPINQIAPSIDFDNQKPFGVDFLNAKKINPINIGILRAGESVPVWIERTVTPNTAALFLDGFDLRITGSPIQI